MNCPPVASYRKLAPPVVTSSTSSLDAPLAQVICLVDIVTTLVLDK